MKLDFDSLVARTSEMIDGRRVPMIVKESLRCDLGLRGGVVRHHVEKGEGFISFFLFEDALDPVGEKMCGSVDFYPEWSGSNEALRLILQCFDSSGTQLSSDGCFSKSSYYDFELGRWGRLEWVQDYSGGFEGIEYPYPKFTNES